MIRRFLGLFARALIGWNGSKAPVFAAAIAYSTLFSMAPLLVLSLIFASFTLQESAVAARLLATVEEQAGPGAADLVRQLLGNVVPAQVDGKVTLFSLGLLLFGASGVFLQLRGALNAMWHIDTRHTSVRNSILGMGKSYVISLSAAIVIGLVPILAVFSSALAATMPRAILARIHPDEGLVTLLDILTSPAAYFVLVFAMFRLLPQASVSWRALLPGSLVTALLYWIGNAILVWFLGTTRIVSLYGVAGSAIALLLWAYYSGWILLYGAKFIYVYAAARGHPIVPHREAGVVETRFKAETK